MIPYHIFAYFSLSCFALHFHINDIYIINDIINDSNSYYIQYCAIETCSENEILFLLPHIFHTNSPEQNFCETVFPHFLRGGGN